MLDNALYRPVNRIMFMDRHRNEAPLKITIAICQRKYKQLKFISDSYNKPREKPQMQFHRPFMFSPFTVKG